MSCEQTGAPADLTYRLDLDASPPVLGDPSVDPSGRYQNGAFYLSTSPSVIAVDAVACRGNYAWGLEIRYRDGEQESANGLGGQTLVFVVEIEDTEAP